MSKMIAKGQVAIPKRLREHLGLKPGSEIAFELAQDGRVFLKAQARPKSAFSRLRGSVKLAMTTDEIMALSRGENGT